MKFYVINSEQDLINITEKEKYCFFINTYMTTRINKYLQETENESEIFVYILNIGNNSGYNLEAQQEYIVNELENDCYLEETEDYRRYNLLSNNFYKYIDLKVGIISDQIQYMTIEGSTNLYYINENTIEEALKVKLDVFIFITSWHGLYGEYVGQPRNIVNEKLLKMVKKIKDTGIPIVFYSKEDPPNFNSFKEFSKHANVIITSSLEKVNEYKKINKSADVYNFTYGINPKLHNPIKIVEDGDYIFAGTWFNNKYNTRMKDTKSIFEYMDKNGKNFQFYNRNYNDNNELFKVPIQYKKYEKKNLSYRELIKKSKQYRWNINLNSVIDDYTMCAVRVYELQAMGKNILSNYSIPLYVDFPNVTLFSNENMNHEYDIEDKILGIRNIYSSNTIFDLWSLVLEPMGLLTKLQNKSDEIIFKTNKRLMNIDILNTFKYAVAENIVTTQNSNRYFTYQNSLETNETIIGQLKSKKKVNKFFLIPKSKYYSAEININYIDINNIEEIENYSPKEGYVYMLSDVLKNSKYINSIVKEKSIQLIDDLFPNPNIHKNIDISYMNLIKCIKYYGEVKVYMLGREILKFDEKSMNKERFIYDVKESIKKKEYYDFDIANYIYNIIEE